MNNKIYFHDKEISEYEFLKNIELNIEGKNNIIKLYDIVGKGKLRIKLINAENCYIEIGKGNKISKGTLSVFAIPHIGKDIPGGKCIIGENNIFNGDCNITIPLHNNNCVKIGNNNLFAHNVNIVGLSEHLVYDLETKIQTNIEKGVNIGNNIWIGTSATIINKAKIPDNSIVGRNSLVTKSFDQENSLIAGIPASVKRTNISWHISLDNSYLCAQNPFECVHN